MRNPETTDDDLPTPSEWAREIGMRNNVQHLDAIPSMDTQIVPSRERQTTIPPGWKLVPIEPTDAMLDEICREMDRFGWPVHALQAWRAVLSVVPAPESQRDDSDRR